MCGKASPTIKSYYISGYDGIYRNPFKMQRNPPILESTPLNCLTKIYSYDRLDFPRVLPDTSTYPHYSRQG